MKISKRTQTGWSYDHDNESKTNCDDCKAKLYEAPHGGTYCDTVHISRYKVLDSDGKYVYSTKFLERLLAYCDGTLSIGKPKTLEDAIGMLEYSKFYLITE